MEDTQMQVTDNNERLKIRKPDRPDDEAGVVLPKRTRAALFQGWGPKLMAAALTIGTLALSSSPAKAAKVVAQAMCEDRGAALISSPAFDVPDGAAGGRETLLRVDLSAEGTVTKVSLAQTSGDDLLDFEAMRVAITSRYAAAIIGCEPAADSFLYRVIFAN
jgi:hypothetical protein